MAGLVAITRVLVEQSAGPGAEVESGMIALVAERFAFFLCLHAILTASLRRVLPAPASGAGTLVTIGLLLGLMSPVLALLIGSTPPEGVPWRTGSLVPWRVPEGEPLATTLSLGIVVLASAYFVATRAGIVRGMSMGAQTCAGLWIVLFLPPRLRENAHAPPGIEAVVTTVEGTAWEYTSLLLAALILVRVVHEARAHPWRFLPCGLAASLSLMIAVGRPDSPGYAALLLPYVVAAGIIKLQPGAPYNNDQPGESSTRGHASYDSAVLAVLTWAITAAYANPLVGLLLACALVIGHALHRRRSSPGARCDLATWAFVHVGPSACLLVTLSQ